MYWETLKQICFYNERVDYGKQIVSRPATKLVEKYGKVSTVEISALKNVNYKPESATMQDAMQVTMQVTIQDDQLKKLVIFCSDARTREEM